MSTYARINAGVVAELFTIPPGASITDYFNASLLWVDVTAASPAPAVGWLASEPSGFWLFTAPPSDPPAPNFPRLAQFALDASDVTMIRCFEHGVAATAAWLAHRATLRQIVSGEITVTAMPTKPDYPEGS